MYHILKYDGPPCRECCGFYDYFVPFLNNFTFEEAVEFMSLKKDTDGFWNDYIICTDNSITSAVFYHEWIKPYLIDELGLEIPSIDDFLMTNTAQGLYIIT
jgi:predicted HAD superfamily hydrolase